MSERGYAKMKEYTSCIMYEKSYVMCVELTKVLLFHFVFLQIVQLIGQIMPSGGQREICG